MLIFDVFFSEPMWPIEARCAAIANNYFVVGINRVGTVSRMTTKKECFKATFKPVFHFNRIVPKRSVFLCFLSGRVELMNE
jgi:hypothetical protein